MLSLRRFSSLSSFILENISSFSTPNKVLVSSKKFSIMSTTPKVTDVTTGSQGEAPTSKGPQAKENETSRYEIVERGQLHTLSYRCYFRDVLTKLLVSPFHDIPLINEQYSSSTSNQGTTVYNMVVEVPRWTNAKLEINKKLKLNPLVQDVKNGKLILF